MGISCSLGGKWSVFVAALACFSSAFPIVLLSAFLVAVIVAVFMIFSVALFVTHLLAFLAALRVAIVVGRLLVISVLEETIRNLGSISKSWSPFYVLTDCISSHNCSNFSNHSRSSNFCRCYKYPWSSRWLPSSGLFCTPAALSPYM